MKPWLWFVPALIGCTGAIGEGRSGDSTLDPGAGGGPGGSGSVPDLNAGATPGMDEPPPPGGPPPTPEQVATICETVDPGPAPLRRLTRFEYNNTVRDLLGDTTSPANVLPPEELGNGFGNDANALGVSRLLIERYIDVSSGLATRATADAPKRAALLGCTPAVATAPAEEACVKSFVTAFGARAYRRPVNASDVDPLLALFRSLRPNGTFEIAVRGVIQAMLMSPSFLYRVEFGTPPRAGALYTSPGQYEMASRLSYMLWGTMPDAALFDAARAGRLQTKDQVRMQAERMLADAKAREIARFFHGVLFKLEGSEGLQKNAISFPRFSSGAAGGTSMAPALKQETERFLDHVIWDGAGDLGTLLTANYSFMNADVARYYGVVGPAGTAFERVDLDPKQRAGLLTKAILLSLSTPGTETNPTLRGVFVLERLLCARPPDPPNNINLQAPTYTPDQTTRERFIEHSTNPACSGCHALMDPIGFSFEHYDPAGVWRAQDNGKPVDATGEVVGDGIDLKGSFNGAVELAGKLATSDQVRACMVAHWFTFAYGRGQSTRDRCSRASLESAFAQSGYKLRDLLLALTQTDAFLRRPVNTP